MGMKHFTEEEYSKLNPPTSADEDPESELGMKIREYAKKQGYPCLTHPQTRKLSRFIPAGYPDVILSLPHGITLYIELKSKKGVLKEKQKLMAMQLMQLGHQYHKIKSFKEFLKLVDQDHLEFQGRILK